MKTHITYLALLALTLIACDMVIKSIITIDNALIARQSEVQNHYGVRLEHVSSLLIGTNNITNNITK